MISIDIILKKQPSLRKLKTTEIISMIYYSEAEGRLRLKKLNRE